jgi:hypothetical protein
MKVSISFILVLTAFFVLYQVQYAKASTGHESNNSSNDNILLFDAHTIPETVHVGDSFLIVATVVNDSPTSITFLSHVCNEQQLSIQFSKNNNIIKQFKNPCIALASLITLNPGESITVQAPGNHGIIYSATAPGRADAVLKFYYRLHQQSEQHFLQKLLVFNILQ